MISAHEYQYGDLLLGPAGCGEVLDATTLYATVRWEDGREEALDQFTPRVVVDVRGFDRPGLYYICMLCGEYELTCDANPDDWAYFPDGVICLDCLDWQREIKGGAA